MKTKCRIADSKELEKIAASHIANEMGMIITYGKDVSELRKNGKFRFEYRDQTGIYGGARTFTANELANIINMSQWEIVGIDNGGSDELAILFYEEN